MTSLLHSKSAALRAACVVGACFAVVSGLATPVRAASIPIGIQASGGWNTENEDFLIGAGARFGVGPVTLIANGEWFFVDQGSTYSLNLDGTLNVLPMGVATFYVGAGTGMYTVDPEFGDSNTEAVLNVIGGVGFPLVPFKPFGQFKWIVIDGDDPIVATVGIRF